VTPGAATGSGGADPNTDPSGYRTLLVWQLAERYYREPRLYEPHVTRVGVGGRLVASTLRF